MNESQSPSQANRLRTHWPLLAAGMLSQACPSAAPLFHSCAMLLSAHQHSKATTLAGSAQELQK